ncbi:cytochrome P450 2L1 [Armadillidium vulgare]|nr:cytochrome P450 2L1 [Armadillidium vulgare]
MWIEIVLLLLIIWLIWNNVKKPSDYPPGPWGLPLIGCLPIDLSNIDIMVEEMRRKYGQIFSMRIGSRFVVFLCEYKIIQEALQNPAFANRPDVLIFMGIGEDIHKNAIHFEALELVQAFKAQAGKAVPITRAVAPAVINVSMANGGKYKLDDKDVIDFQNKLKDFEHSASGMIVVDIFPWLRSIIPEFILDRLSKKTKYLDLVNQLTTWFKTEVNNHMKTLDSTNPRRFY